MPFSAAASSSGTNYDRGRVAARAYELYLERGGTGGSDMDDWLSAEREYASNRNPAPHED
jgi:outer membrane protein TolC